MHVKSSLAGALMFALLAGGAHAASLVSVVQEGDSGTAMQMLESGADANSAMKNGTTALHWAVYNGDLALVDALIEAGADVDAMNDYGSSPMSEAATLGDEKLIARLLEAGADPDSPNADGQTALMIIARSDNVAAAKLLIEAGAEVDAVENWQEQTALVWAAAQSQPRMVKLLVEHGADPNARSHVNNWKRHITAERRYQWRAPGGITGLIYAAREGCTECARILVEAGADIDQADDGGVTALLASIINMNFDTAKYLVEAGANVDKWSIRGENPVYAAVDVSTLPHGGYPDRPSTDETSPHELLQILLEAGANPNLQLKLQPTYRHLKDDRGADRMLNIGATPLLRAAKAFDVPSMELLIEHGAHVNLPNRDGITPVMAAAGLGSNSIDTRGDYTGPNVGAESKEALQLLLANGGEISARDSLGRTALHGAASWGWNEAVECLVAEGASLTAEDQGGLIPLDNALGKSTGSFGRGTSGEVREDTAQLLRDLMAEKESGSGV